jgi:hypothetical protein
MYKGDPKHKRGTDFSGGLVKRRERQKKQDEKRKNVFFLAFLCFRLDPDSQPRRPIVRD